MRRTPSDKPSNSRPEHNDGWVGRKHVKQARRRSTSHTRHNRRQSSGCQGTRISMICLLTVDHAAIHEYPGAGPRTLAHSLLRKVGDLTLAHTHRTSLPSLRSTLRAVWHTHTHAPLYASKTPRGGDSLPGQTSYQGPSAREVPSPLRTTPPFLSYPTLVHLVHLLKPWPFPFVPGSPSRYMTHSSFFVTGLGLEGVRSRMTMTDSQI